MANKLWLDVSSMLGKLRYLISTVAIFVALWALLAMIVTALLAFLPIGSGPVVQAARWLVSLFILLYLIKNGNILINK